MKKVFFYLVIVLVISCHKAEYQAIPEHSFEALPLTVLSPDNNLTTDDKIILGKLLFYDPVLSSNNSISCATCHHPTNGYADGRGVSIGFGGTGIGINRIGEVLTSRNAPTILNVAFNGMNIEGEYDPSTAVMFFDNRVKSLEEQSLIPIFEKKEMRGNVPIEGYTKQIENKLTQIRKYRTLFYNAFGDSLPTLANVSKAIAAFERTLITPNSPYDKFVRGDIRALDERQIRGMEAFVEVGCIKCHSGPMFSDYNLHVLGIRERENVQIPDQGNGNFAFRTPTLRNLDFTAPYMHNGEYNTLEEVMDFYEAKESEHPRVSNSELARDFQELNFNLLNRSRKHEIISFMKALNDSNFDKEVPQSVPSGLIPGGS